MASVNVEKATKGKIKAVAKHVDRRNENYSNKDINADKTSLNYTIGCKDYADAVNNNIERVKAVDAVLPPKRIKKDRVTALEVEFPCPRSITDAGRSDEFFDKAYKTLEEYLGVDNVHGAVIHKDEVHEYYDKAKDAYIMSCEHAHVVATPYVNGVGVNAKQCVTKDFLRGVNAAMEEMCVREFGEHYQTGLGARHIQTELLKAQGARDMAEKELARKTALERDNADLSVTNKALMSQQAQLNEELLNNAVKGSTRGLFGKKDVVNVIPMEVEKVENLRANVKADIDTISNMSQADVEGIALYKASIKEKATAQGRIEKAERLEKSFDRRVKEKAEELVLNEYRSGFEAVKDEVLKSFEVEGQTLYDVAVSEFHARLEDGAQEITDFEPELKDV
jgi:hypothetical protein